MLQKHKKCKSKDLNKSSIVRSLFINPPASSPNDPALMLDLLFLEQWVKERLGAPIATWHAN